MIKILCFGRSCKHYFRLYQDHGPSVNLCCDHCGRTLHKHGRYFRGVTSKREWLQIPIYRWYCPHCKMTVSLLPDFLVPWARFTTWTREAAIVRKRSGYSWQEIAHSIVSSFIHVSTSTVKRWWKKHLLRAQAASQWLAHRLTLSGYNGDLLRKHPHPVSASPLDTVIWLAELQKLYTSEHSRLRGYWSFLNASLPTHQCL